MSDPQVINCDEALRLLAAFLDHELHVEERGSVERHLATCRSCFSRAEFERRLKSEVGRTGREDIPAAFDQRVRRLLASFAAVPGEEPAGGSPT